MSAETEGIETLTHLHRSLKRSSSRAHRAVVHSYLALREWRQKVESLRDYMGYRVRLSQKNMKSALLPFSEKKQSNKWRVKKITGLEVARIPSIYFQR